MSAFFVKVAEIDTERAPASRVLTGPELRSAAEVLRRVRGVETTITERAAMDTLRELIDEAAQA